MQRSRVARAAIGAADILQAEQQVYAAACREKVARRSKFDVVELWADQANVTRLASRFGLVAAQPFGLRYGVRINADDAGVWAFVYLCAPLLLIMAVPCTVWSILNWNINYLFRRKELLTRQAKEKHQIFIRCGRGQTPA